MVQLVLNHRWPASIAQKDPPIPVTLHVSGQVPGNAESLDAGLVFAQPCTSCCF